MASPDRPARRIAAILNAEGADYSKLMAADESGTLRALHAQRARLRSAVEAHGGRVVDAVGDNLLAEFPSAVNALTCAVDAQRALRDADPELPDERRLRFRIGLHLGDVIVDGDSIAGDGVNIAARIQSQAEAGGIALSGAFFDQVDGKLDLAIESLGERALKNLPRPVRVYQVSTGVPKPQRANAATSVSESYREKFSIAVLPFENLSSDAEQDHLADGIAEDLITRFVHWRLPMISRTSSFAYRGRQADARQIARELGARLLVEGSVRRSGGTVRVTAQLIEGSTGNHLWAGRWDRPVGDLFALQDEIVSEIEHSMGSRIDDYAEEKTLHRDPSSLTVWEILKRAEWHRARATRDDWEIALKFAGDAIARDPSFNHARAVLSVLHCDAAEAGWTEDRAASIAAALEEARRAVAFDANDPAAHSALGCALVFAGQPLRGREAYEMARALQPDWAWTSRNLAWCLAVTGFPDEVPPLLEAARGKLRSDRMLPSLDHLLALVRFGAGRDDEAAELAKRALVGGAFPQLKLVLAAISGFRGQPEDAQRFLEGRSPERISDLRRRLGHIHPSLLDRLCEGLRLAGVSD